MVKIEEFKSCLKEVNMSKEVKEDIIEAVEEYSLDEDLLNLYDKEKIIESDKILAKEEGIKEEKMNIAKNAITNGIDIETISKITGLSIEEINNL